MNVQRIRKSLVIAVMGLFLLPLLSACGGPTSVNATLTEDYQIQLSKDTVKAGDITFHIKNDATDLNHEFVIVNSDLQAANLPLDADGNVDEEQIEVVDEAEELEPGSTTDLTVNLQPGHYVIMCNIAGHYAQGMHVDFTVE